MFSCLLFTKHAASSDILILLSCAKFFAFCCYHLCLNENERAPGEACELRPRLCLFLSIHMYIYVYNYMYIYSTISVFVSCQAPEQLQLRKQLGNLHEIPINMPLQSARNTTMKTASKGGSSTYPNNTGMSFPPCWYDTTVLILKELNWMHSYQIVHFQELESKTQCSKRFQMRKLEKVEPEFHLEMYLMIPLNCLIFFLCRLSKIKNKIDF